MLIALVVFMGWYVAGSVTLVSGLVTGNQRLQRLGIGCMILLTLGALGIAVAHDRSLPQRGFSGSMLK